MPAYVNLLQGLYPDTLVIFELNPHISDKHHWCALSLITMFKKLSHYQCQIEKLTNVMYSWHMQNVQVKYNL